MREPDEISLFNSTEVSLAGYPSLRLQAACDERGGLADVTITTDVGSTTTFEDFAGCGVYDGTKRVYPAVVNYFAGQGPEGNFAGQTISDVAAKLRSGASTAADVPVTVVGDGLIVNTRSSLALRLRQAGIPQSQWNLIRGSAQEAADIAARLSRNGLGPTGTNVIRIESDDGDRKAGIIFDSVEAYKCTHMTARSVEMIKTAYDKLVSLDDSAWLSEVKANSDSYYAKRQGPPMELQHLMIFFDDGPCYEFICVGFKPF
jgi:hypothetical protein